MPCPVNPQPLDGDARLARNSLLRIIEKLFLGDTLALPALVGDFLHAGHAAVGPFEAENPANGHMVAIEKGRAYAGRGHGAHPGHHRPLLVDMKVTPDSRRLLILLQ